MQINCTPKGKHLKVEERYLIVKWHNEKISNREIARRLGRCHQTINNELKRGLVIQEKRCHHFRKMYHPDFAQARYLKCRKNSVRKSTITKDTIKDIQYFIKKKISPEMMVNVYGVKNKYIHNILLDK